MKKGEYGSEEILIDLLSVLIIILIAVILYVDIPFFFDIEELDYKLLFSIQATIAVLGIAVISLVTSSENESYLGVNLSSFFTKLCAPILNSQSIIIIQLSSLIIGMLLFQLKLDWLIPLGLITSVVLTIRQVVSIFGLYREDEYVMKSIENYLHEKFASKKMDDRLQVLEYLENGDKKLSRYAERMNFESILNEYINLAASLGKEDKLETRTKLLDSYIAFQKKYIKKDYNDSIEFSTRSFISMIAKIDHEYPESTRIIQNYNKLLYEYFENNVGKLLQNFKYVHLFYKSILTYLPINDKNSNLYNEIYLIPIQYLYLLRDKFKNEELDIDTDNNVFEGIFDGLIYVVYEFPDAYRIIPEYIYWLIFNKANFKNVSIAIDKYYNIISISDKKKFLKLNNGFISIILLFYQICVFEKRELAELNEMKAICLDVLKKNENISRYLFDLLFYPKKERLLSRDVIERYLFSWEVSYTRNDESGDILYGNSIDEFFITFLLTAKMSIDDLSRMFEIFEINVRDLNSHVGTHITSSTTEIEGFIKLFLKVDQKVSSEELSNEAQRISELILKKEFKEKNAEFVKNDEEVSFRINNETSFKKYLETQFSHIIRKSDDALPIKKYEITITDEFDHLNNMLKPFYYNELASKFINHVYLNFISRKLIPKYIEDDKNALVERIMHVIEKSRYKVDTLLGYTNRFYAYDNFQILRNKIASFKSNLPINVGQNIIDIINMSLFSIDVVNIDVKVSKVKFNYFQSSGIHILSKDKYVIRLDQFNRITLSKEEYKDYINKRIRKVTVSISFRIEVPKNGAGYRILIRNKD